MKIRLTHRFAFLITGLLLACIVAYIYFVENYYVSMLKNGIDNDVIIQKVALLSSYLIIMALIISILFLVLLFRFVNVREHERSVLAQLQELSSVNRRYFENAAIGFVVVDEACTMINVNPKFCEIFGYEADELLGRSIAMLHLDQEHFKQWDRQTVGKVHNGEDVMVRYPMRHANGSRIWMDVTGSLLMKGSRLPEGGVLWAASDANDAVRTLELLEESNQHLRENNRYLKTLINTAPTPLYVKDKDFRYQECNGSFLELFNKSRDEVIGKKDEEIFDLFFAEQMTLRDRTIVEYGYHVFKLRFLSNEIARVMEFYTSAIMHQGHFDGYIGFCVDVTEKENRELYLNQRIEQEVMRNLDMQKRHFDERMEDVKFSALGKLAAGVTHEINTPLTYIKGNLEMISMEIESLKENGEKDALKQDLTHVYEGVKRIESIVASMREMSQQSGESKEEVNLIETVMTALTLGYSRSKHIATITLQKQVFKYGMPPVSEECKVVVQRQRMEQVWVIILNNALDELEKRNDFDSNHITITCKHANKQVIVRFEDTGGGIDETILENIFDPFVSTKPQGGIGIGLNIAKKIVVDQHGDIRAFNGEKGAIFEIMLPALLKDERLV